MKCWYRVKHHYLGIRLGFDIPPNTCGKGLRIHHYGLVIVNPNSRIGDNCVFQQGIIIGNNGKTLDAPTIGNNVHIGAGAKIIGPVKISDNCRIGCNAVVNKSCLEKGKTIVGVPAKIL